MVLRDSIHTEVTKINVITSSYQLVSKKCYFYYSSLPRYSKQTVYLFICLGRKGLISTVDYAMGISTAIVQGLSEIPSIKLLSPEQGSYMVRFGYRGPPFLLKKGKESTHSAPEEPTQYLPVEVG